MKDRQQVLQWVSRCGRSLTSAKALDLDIEMMMELGEAEGTSVARGRV